jgi:hypothetical protein
MVCALTACAAIGSNTSWVGTLQPGDATAVASEMTGFLKQELPPARSTLFLDPIRTAEGGDLLTPMLVECLRKAGFALTDGSSPAGTAHVVRYLVTPGPDGVLIRITVDRTEGSEFMVRGNSGGLTKAVFAVRSIEP